MTGPGLPFGAGTSLQYQPCYYPSDITNCGYVLDAAQGITLTGGAVSAWQEISRAASASVTDGGNAAQRPALVASVPQFGGQPGVLFNGTANYLSGNNAVFQNTQNFTRLIVLNQVGWTPIHMVMDSYSASPRCALMQASSAGGSDPRVGNSTAGMLGFYTGPIIAPNSSPTTGIGHMVLAEYAGAASTISVDGGPVTTGTFSANSDGITIGAGGGAATTYCSNINVALIAEWTRLLTSSEKLGLLNYVNMRFGIKRARPNLYLTQGDSITQANVCAGVQTLQSYPAIVNQRILGGRWELQNIGQGGYTAQSDASIGSMLPYIDSSRDRILASVALGVNDITANRTALQIQGDLATICNAARAAAVAAGVPIKILLATITPNNAHSGGQEAIRVAVNTYIRNAANWGTLGIDNIIDVASASGLPAGVFATQAATTNLTYYAPGGLHPNCPGTAFMAQIHGAAITTLLAA